MTEYENLNNELKIAGVPNHEFMGEILSPIETLVNTNTSAKPYIDILLKYLPRLTGNENVMVVRALAEKGMKKAVPYLLDILKNPDNYNSNILWTVANTLSIIDDKNSYSEIIEVCTNTKLGAARQLLLGTLSKARTDKAYQTLINCLTDPDLRGHAIEALGQYGDPRAIRVLENIEVDNAKYEYKAKISALKRLKNEKLR